MKRFCKAVLALSLIVVCARDARAAPGDPLIPTDRGEVQLTGPQATQVGALVTTLFPDVPLANIQRFLCWPVGPMAPVEVDGQQVENGDMNCRVEDNRRVTAAQLVTALAAGKKVSKTDVTPVDGQPGQYDVLVRSQPAALSVAQRNGVLNAGTAWLSVATGTNLLLFDVYRVDDGEGGTDIMARATEKVPQSADSWILNWLADLAQGIVGVE